MNRLILERRQVWIYLSAIMAGLLVGNAWPGVGPTFETLLWPTLMLLLYATFMQVPLLQLREAFTDHRFVTAVHCRLAHKLCAVRSIEQELALVN